MRKFLLLIILLKTVDTCAQQPVLLGGYSTGEASVQSVAPLETATSTNPLTSPNPIPPTWAPPLPLVCTSAVFHVIETKMNRTKTVSVPLGTSIRYNTLIIQPQSCTEQNYAGDHKNITVNASVWTLPYRVMHEPKLVSLFPPTLIFSGLMSTISPTFAHANYAIIPVGCQTVPCTVGG